MTEQYQYFPHDSKVCMNMLVHEHVVTRTFYMWNCMLSWYMCRPKTYIFVAGDACFEYLYIKILLDYFTKSPQLNSLRNVSILFKLQCIKSQAWQCEAQSQSWTRASRKRMTIYKIPNEQRWYTDYLTI